MLFVLLPVSYQVHEDVTSFCLRALRIDPTTVDLGQPNELLAHSFAASGLDVIDLLPALRARASAGARVNGAVVLVASDAWGPYAAAVGLFAGQVVAIAMVVALVPETREFGVLGSLGVSWLAAPAAVPLLLAGAIGGVAATSLALLVLLAAVRSFRVVAPREVTYLEGVGPRFGRLSRLLLAPIR